MANLEWHPTITQQKLDMHDTSKVDSFRAAEMMTGTEASLHACGNAVLPGVLTASQCRDLVAMYALEAPYRARVVMARHGFGRGEYKYFAYPLPEVLAQLRAKLYDCLAPIANRWNEQLGLDIRYPRTLQDFLKRCHDAGQCRSTPLSLAYREGDYNCLHQDLYGEHVFPLQVAMLLSRPGEDFTGGEFVMTESGTGPQLAHVVPLKRGDAVIFAVNQRPAPGKHRPRKIAMRHGVSKIRSGRRHTVGLIFHDAL